MDLRQIRYFLAVATSGSFTAASHSLRVSQPALGLQVKQLEDQLGVRLLERHSRGVTLTKAGAVFHRHAVTILEGVERAEAALFPFKASQRTDVLIGVTPNTARHIVPDLLEDCVRCTTPLVRIMVRQGHSAEMLTEVENRTLDMAFCYDKPKSDRIGTLPLYGEDLVLLGPTELMNGSGDVELQDLPNFPLIMSGTQRGARAFVEAAAARCGVELSIRHEIEAIGLKRELLLRNRCCTIVSLGPFIDDVQHGVFSARRIVKPTLSRDFHLAYRRDLPEDVLDLILSNVRKIVARRLGEKQVGWRKPGKKHDSAASWAETE
jgi:LysR family nitrogen assimilation transcriptional regulator